MPRSKILSQILSKLGTLKNEFLIFVILCAILMFIPGFQLSNAEEGWKQVCGVVIFFLIVSMMIGVVAFYLYATVKLPGSAQELLFAQAAERTLNEHAKKLRPRKGVAHGRI